MTPEAISLIEKLISTLGFPIVITLILLYGYYRFATSLREELTAIKVELTKQTILLAKLTKCLEQETNAS